MSWFICAFCHKSAWRRSMTLGRHRLHKSCVDDLFESVWEAAHPKIHGGWTEAQIDSLIRQMIVERLP